MNLPPLSLALAACAFLYAAAPDSRADTIMLSASQDNTLYEHPTGDLSNAVGDHLFAGRTFQAPDEDLRRALLAFDLSLIPAGSVINSVSLTLYMNKSSVAGTENFSLHRVLADWGEGTSDAANFNVEEGAGDSATAGDATWLHGFAPSSLWTAPGGDFAATASATLAVAKPTGFYSWSSAAMAADAQLWLDNPGTGFGWILIGNESAEGTAKRFSSRENAVASERPVLNIDFTPVPEPSRSILVAMAVAAGTLCRRRP